MSVVDANIILRYLLDDHAELSPKAAEILEHQTVNLPIEVACEVVYVLQKVYAVDRKEIRQQLGNLVLPNLRGKMGTIKSLRCLLDKGLSCPSDHFY
jgi:predicted nucleic-acid-binding protein